MAGSDKTEKPTPKRRKEARKKGQVARSQELVSWSMVLVALIMLPGFFGRGRAVVVEMMMGFKRVCLDPQPSRMIVELHSAFSAFFGLVLPLMIVMCVIAVVANVAQTGPMMSSQALKPQLSRLNPIQGVKRIFSSKSLWETGKQLVRLVIITAVVWPVVRSTVDQVAGRQMDMWDMVGLVGNAGLRVARTVTITALVIAAVDYVFQKKQTAKSQRMSKQEVREEFKQAEGNQEVKGKIKSLQIQATRNRMLAAVGDANVVVVNPIHIAVALRYDPSRGAPRVVAKGAGAVAERIRDEATRTGVPIVESIPLARALHRSVELDDEIPAHLYEGVARLLAFVQRLAGRMPMGGGYHRLQEPVGVAL